MPSLKGFINIAQYINNTPGQLSTLGEISTWSLTYSKEKGLYDNPQAYPGYQLISFESLDDNQNPAAVSTSVQTNVFRFITAIMAYVTSHTRPYNDQDFTNYINAELNGTFTNFSYGEWIDNGQISLPGWISWSTAEVQPTAVRLWLADSVFRSQYDKYSIDVVPPILPIDIFFNDWSTVVQQLQLLTNEDYTNKLQDAKGDFPETYLRTQMLSFVNRQNTSLSYPTPWGMLIYGIAGDNVDARKDAIIEYIQENSSHDLDDWAAIFPELFKRTEFLFLPRWDKVAIPNLSNLSVLYSAYTEPEEVTTFALNAIVFYSADHVRDNIRVFPNPFKCVTVVGINGDNNVAGKTDLALVYPDYLSIPNTSLDFSRMTIPTQQFVLLLDQALQIAEDPALFPVIPTGFTRATRSNNLYIAFSHDGVNHLVAAKTNAYYS